ncbi:MAG: hypothetical protein ACP5GR_02115 [Thermoplasmata archaeon]
MKGITSGKMYAAETITENTGRSDLFNIMGTEEVKKMEILNGIKRFLVEGNRADFFVVNPITD